tara:strand:+ start:438 stop:902 length:465 start_codon:yes stop_codon:yes gene_type:complete
MSEMEYQTPVGEIAPYIARNTDVPTGTDVGVLTVILRAPPNANVQIVQIGAYGDWGTGILPVMWLVPPDGSTDLSVGTPNSYPLFNGASDLQGTTISAPVGWYLPDRNFNGAQVWIPAGWGLAVAPSGTTSGSVATWSAVGITHASVTWGSNRR